MLLSCVVMPTCCKQFHSCINTDHSYMLLPYCATAFAAADALPAACPVHRLDAMTGGLVLCARTLTAAQRLTQAFENR
jgi:23S rRNA-/tRNA-specific pseudouridylate synthase